MVVNSSLWFALLRLFKTIETVYMKKRVTMSVFAFCFISANLTLMDAAQSQSNGLVFAITILSFCYMIERRYLMSAFWYCFVLSTKQITAYYSLAYFIYLLIVYGFTPSFNFTNLFKLGSLVIVFHAIVYLPFVGNLESVYHQLTGGSANAIKYPMPNLQCLYSFLEVLYAGKYSKTLLFPPYIKAILFLVSMAILGRFIYFRHQNPKYFPLFAFLSG